MADIGSDAAVSWLAQGPPIPHIVRKAPAIDHCFLNSLVVMGTLAAPAQATECNLALVLALDVSGSVDANEDSLQREGVANALLAQAVKTAFLERAPVALVVFEWSTPSHQEPLLPCWKIVESEQDLVDVSKETRVSRRGGDTQRNPTTAVGSALGFAAAALRDGPLCDAATIDVSGDGKNNQGSDPSHVSPALRVMSGSEGMT